MIEVDISKCTGCRCCETTCTFFHTGRVSDHLARIKVGHIYEKGIDGPAVCQLCRERYCLECPENALTIGSAGQVIVSPTNCERCGLCEQRCPIGAIELYENIVYVCDLCGGEPKCVQACTEGAIFYEPDRIETESLAAVKAKTKGLNTSQKRRHFLEQRGRELHRKRGSRSC